MERANYELYRCFDVVEYVVVVRVVNGESESDDDA